MKKEFSVKNFKDATVYTLESATGGGTSSGSVASVSMPMGGVRKRGDNLIAQEGNKDTVPATTPRNFVAKNAKTSGAGAHKDKKKAEKQGDVKHKKPYAESLQEKLNAVLDEDHSTASNGWGKSSYDTYTNGRHGRGVAEDDDEENNPQHSHQYDTTIKHAKNPTVQQRMAAHDIKPGIAGYKDRVDLLKDLERTGKLKSEDAYMQELFSKLAEKIPADAPVDVWVKDFQKADPNKYHQFKNKTPEKKSQMAVAASYAAKNPNKKK